MTLAEVQAMSDEEARVMVAEKCGWKRADCECGCDEKWWAPGATFPVISPPDYCSDLNACHEFEKGLTDEEWVRYIDALKVVLHAYTNSYKSVRAKVHANGRQRCEAFLMVGGAQC